MCKNGHHSETPTWEVWWNLGVLLQNQAFGFGVEQPESLYCIFSHIHGQCLLLPVICDFSLGHYFKKSRKTLLTAISSELKMPSLAGALCLKRNTASYYEPADSLSSCSNSRQSYKSSSLSLILNIKAVSRGRIKWTDESLLKKCSQFG